MNVEQVLIPAMSRVIRHQRLTNALFRFSSWGNPFTDEVYADPYPLQREMAEGGPVQFRREYQQWFVMGHDEVQQVLRSPSFAVGGQTERLLQVRPYSKLADESLHAIRHWLVLTDPPVHTWLRALVAKAFTPRRMRELEPRAAKIAEELLADVADQPELDLARSFTVPLPMYVISELLGIPRERREWLRECGNELTKVLDPYSGFDPGRIDRIFAEMSGYFGAEADFRREHPSDDLLTDLVHAESEGSRLSRAELIAMVGFLLFAGFETTAGALGNSVIALHRFPEQQALLRSRPDLMPNAVEELLRYDSPVRTDPRAATADVVIGDHTIAAGDNVALMLTMANRDPARYDRPDELMLDRDDPSPISFGHGIHHCLGASLARMELRVGLAAFLDAFPRYDVDVDAVEWKRSLTLRGPVGLPVSR